MMRTAPDEKHMLLRKAPESGVSTLEFSLIIFLILGIIAIIVDLGLALRRYQVITKAAVYGARHAAALSAPESPGTHKSLAELGQSSKQKTFDYLTENNLIAANVKVETKPCFRQETYTEPLTEPPKNLDLLFMHVKVTDKTKCYLCLSRWVLPPFSSSSSFMLDPYYATLTPLPSMCTSP